jgi:hypothetical protein
MQEVGCLLFNKKEEGSKIQRMKVMICNSRGLTDISRICSIYITITVVGDCGCIFQFLSAFSRIKDG